MTLHEEVIAFAREYVNKPKSRTPERKRKIKEVYIQVFGQLFNLKCGSCYIAAILKIVNHNKPKTTINEKPKITQKPMTHNYQLKPGALLKAFGDVSKFATNANLTDELAQWHLQHNPGCAKLFSRIPAGVQIQPVSSLTIIPDAVPAAESAKLEIVPLPADPLEEAHEGLEAALKTVHREIRKTKTRKTKK
jgi:hypothetical protein